MNSKNNNRKKTTQRDIAQAADVSIATVSMALANSSKIPEKTRQMIIDVARQLDYQILQKRKLHYQKVEHNIGLIVDTSPANAHAWEFIRVMVESLSRQIQFKNSTFIMLPVSESHSKNDILQMVIRSGVSGVISFAYAEESVLTELESQGIPVVLTFNEQRPEGFFYVGHDDFQGGYEATTFLLNLGHRDITYVYTERNNIPFLQSNRFVGYKKAINEWNIQIGQNSIIHFQQSDIQSFRDSILKLLKIITPPTAFLCLDDNIAVILFIILTHAGYRIPEDVSLIAHGDSIDYSNPLNPQITTMCTDLELSSSICCNTLFSRFENPQKSYSSIKTREKLIDRGSCGRNNRAP